MKIFPLTDLTYKIIGICMEVHRHLGHGFLEVVYKDAIEIEANQTSLGFCREKEFDISYKGVLLRHKFFADFVINDNIIVEVKAAEGSINDEYIAQTLNYLRASGCQIGLIVNFGRKSLEYRRLIL